MHIHIQTGVSSTSAIGGESPVFRYLQVSVAHVSDEPSRLRYMVHVFELPILNGSNQRGTTWKTNSCQNIANIGEV